MWCPSESRPSPVTSFPCLLPSGRLPFPVPWDPPARQVPLFVRWEQYANYLRPGLRNVTFIQVGANCGKNTYGCAVGGDPVWAYATMCGWQGITVEPVSYVFKKLCKNYARWPRVRPIRAAISSKHQNEAFVSLGHGETNRLIPRGTNLTTRGGNIRFERVPALNLKELWRLAGAEGTAASMSTASITASSPKTSPHTHDEAALSTPSPNNTKGIKLTSLDLLVIDAEGAEAEILGGDDDVPHPRPALILFEHAHLGRGAQLAISRRLTAQGYKWLADFRNQDPRGKRLPPVNRLFGRVSTTNGLSI